MSRWAISRAIVESIARGVHAANFEDRGSRYAEPEEQRMHMLDPCSSWELVRDTVVSAVGATSWLTADHHGFIFEYAEGGEPPFGTETDRYMVVLPEQDEEA